MAKKNVDDDFSDSFDIDLSVNSRKKSYSLSEFELTEIAMANESRNIIDHIYNILSGNSPLNSKINIPVKVNNVLSSYSSSNKFESLVSLILDVAIDYVQKSAVDYFIPAIINKSLQDQHLTNIKPLSLPPLEKYSRLDSFMEDALKTYSQFQLWLYRDATYPSEFTTSYSAINFSRVIDELTNKIIGLKSSVDKYKSDLVSMNKFNSDLKNDIASLRDSVSDKDNRISDLDHSIFKLKLEYSQLSQAFDSYKKLHPEHHILAQKLGFKKVSK